MSDNDFEDEIKTAVQHAAAVVLQWVQAAERGYTSLVENGPLVTQGVELAHAQAESRGVPPGAIAITGSHVLAAAQEMGAAGADPYAVAEATKAPVADETATDQETAAIPGIEGAGFRHPGD